MSGSLRAAFLAATALVGCAGSDAPQGDDAAFFFREEARERRLVFEHESGQDGERYYFPELMGGGAALFDMDGDGDLDAFCVQSGRIDSTEPTQHRLFASDGSGRFTDVSSGAGVAVPGYGQGVAAGDYDGDGDVDLYVTNVGANRLLANDGAGRFTDVTERAGVGHSGWGTSAAFCDLDDDGDLDLFVTNYIDWSVEGEIECFDPTGQLDYCGPQAYEAPADDVAYRNEGDGTFTDVTSEWFANSPNGFGNGLGVVTGDFDGDGRQDVFVANDQTADNLWLQRAGGGFEDAGERRGVARDPYGGVRAGMGVDAVDYDGDDDLDLVVVHMAREQDGFFVNEGDYFAERTGRVGLGLRTFTSTRFGVGFHDFDLDGCLDLFVANGRVNLMMEPVSTDDRYAEPDLVLRGTSEGRLEPALLAHDLPVLTSRGAAFGDVDGDGAVDVLVVNRDAPATLYVAQPQPSTAAVTFRLVEYGRDALGASARARGMRRECRSAYSYCSASAPRLVFPVREGEALEALEIRWADGSRERREGPFAAGAVIELERR